jgi:TonB family protein
MKFCPKCQTKYDETIIRFCTKDGSPLVDENPSFTAMPSQSSYDDIGEETMITRNRVIVPPLPPPSNFEEPSQRVVIPIGDDKKQAVRPIESPQYQQPARKSNTALVVLLTIFGTVILLAGGVGAWWFLSGLGNSTANTNSNANSNTNVNTNANSNVNTNANANLKPSPTKTPTPKPSNVNTNANVNTNTNANTTIINITPANSNTPSNTKPNTPTATPTAAPKPSESPTKPTPPSNVNIGVMNSRAKELRKPAYPPIAKQMGASGQVIVQVSIDEDGHVVTAKAVSGHALLRTPAEAAARQSSFNPVRVGEKAIRANGTIVYNFINQ